MHMTVTFSFASLKEKIPKKIIAIKRRQLKMMKIKNGIENIGLCVCRFLL